MKRIPDEAYKCSECGERTGDVRPAYRRWTVGGSGIGCAEWHYKSTPYRLCDECESTNWRYCESCGAEIDSYYYGLGYLPDDYEGGTICPGCANKQGIAI